MCLNPKRLYHRSNHWDINKPLYLSVPCGHCAECSKKLRDDWFVRCFYEFQYYRDHGGTTFFYTLTYNNASIPRFCCHYCFSRRHIQLFIKRLRKALLPFGVNIKYMVCSEFGEITARPHYHALFFVDKYVNPFQFYRIVENAWQYGFVKYGDHVGVVKNTAGIKYVTKYVVKDFSHTDKFLKTFAISVYNRYRALHEYMQYRGFIRPSIFTLDDDCKFHFRYVNSDTKELDEIASKFLSKVRYALRSHLPFHLQSSKLGISIIDDKSVDFLDESLNIMSPDGKFRKYPLPRYIKRKLWYDCVENENDGKCTLFVLNDAGIKHYLDRMSLLIDNRVMQYQSVLLNSAKVTDECLSNVISSTGFDFQNRHDLTFFLQHFDVNLRLIAIYSIVFKDRVCPFKHLDVELNDELVETNWYDYARSCIYACSDMDYGKVYSLDYVDKELLTRNLWNNHPYFHMYSVLDELFSAITLTWKQNEYDAIVQQDKISARIRQIYNKH